MRRRVVTMGLVAVCCLAACTPGGSETPSPSPSVPSVTASPSVTSTPSATPTSATERDRAIKAAEGAFVSFWRASDVVAQKGGATELPSELDLLTVGPQKQASLNEARSLKSSKYKSTGFGRVEKFTVIDVGGPSTNPTRVTLTACVDQSTVSVTKSGKPYTKRPTYLRITQAQMRRSGAWQVYVYGSQVVPEGFTCANY